VKQQKNACVPSELLERRQNPVRASKSTEEAMWKIALFIVSRLGKQEKKERVFSGSVLVVKRKA
jgi:hypothetical protein